MQSLKKYTVENTENYSDSGPIKIGVGVSCATFGELLQGVLPSNRNFLVTFPIDLFSEVKYQLSHEPLQILPKHKTKSLKMAKLVLQYLNKACVGIIIISSSVPEGKGMASSSSDLVATARAIADYFGKSLLNTLIEKFLAEIEPSDGVMYHACVSYYQREAILRNHLNYLPPLLIVSVDEGGVVDTIEFNRRRNLFTLAEKYEYAALLQKMENAIRAQDITTIGKISTRSAILNQKLKKNRYLDIFLEINQKINGLGIVVAHSGTYIGIILDKNDPLLNIKKEKIYEFILSNGIKEEIFLYHSLTQ